MRPIFTRLSSRLGVYPTLIGPCTVCNARALVQVFAKRKASLSWAYTHTKAAGLPCFRTTTTRHDKSKDRKEWLVTESIFRCMSFYVFYLKFTLLVYGRQTKSIMPIGRKFSKSFKQVFVFKFSTLNKETSVLILSGIRNAQQILTNSHLKAWIQLISVQLQHVLILNITEDTGSESWYVYAQHSSNWTV